MAHGTTGQEAACLGWQDVAEDSPRHLAETFVERFPEVAACGEGGDPAYARWYAGMIELTGADGMIVMYADWELPEDHVSTVNVRGEVQVPLPPPYVS